MGPRRSRIVGFPWAGIIFAEVGVSLFRASGSLNASQQSIWASLGGGAQGGITGHVRAGIITFPSAGIIFAEVGVSLFKAS